MRDHRGRAARTRAAAALLATLLLIALPAAGCGGIRDGAGADGADGAPPAAAQGEEAQVLAAVRAFVEGDPLERCAASTDRLLAFFYAEGRAGCQGEQGPGEELRGYSLLSLSPAAARVEYTTEADPRSILSVRLVRREGRWLVDEFAVAP